jgi:phytoene dehydrogenase-like protein
MQKKVSFVVLEADKRIGGRLKTDIYEGFLLNHGFQVLQTSYPEARRWLDYNRLKLKSFAPGVIIRVNGKYHCISDPMRRSQDFWSTRYTGRLALKDLDTTVLKKSIVDGKHL